jgi:hypothetical protein
MKRTIFGLCIVAGLALSFLASQQTPERSAPMSNGAPDDANARDEYEFLMQRDPLADAIPHDIYKREQEFAKRIPTREQLALAKGAAHRELTWIERGPNNVGGRTRVFAVDVANANTLIAGAVAGGIWKSINDGASWQLRLQPHQIHTTTCIAQDTRAGKTHIWYVGTGEFRGSTTNNTRWGAFYRGDGIYKSTNNGDSWTLLPSTQSGTPQTTDPFDFCWNVATNPANRTQDEVYAATWKGIYRSIDGGGSWSLVQPSDSGLINTAGFTTDVVVTTTGVVYAFTKQSGVSKIWRSPDGTTWTNITPTGFPTSTGRIVLGPAPSNPNVLYVFIDSPSGFWKYNAASSAWENRSANLPGINTQTGYDMILHVKPDDENFVLVGGTDLYRSRNAFATSTDIANIGGYNYWPDGNHHPDLQGGAFRPGNPNVYYSSHDGGISKSLDINAVSVVWQSLNNGYNVTQFYSVTISPDSGDHAIMAGAQDNGTQYTDQPGMSAWEMVFGGDGTIVELAPIADDRLYTQYQNGPMQRQTRSGLNLTNINPSGATRQLFVNPIALDPNNSRLLYYGAGKSTTPTMHTGLWRNSDAPNATSTVGWTALTATNPGTVSGWTRATSCIGISKTNNPNVVYFGTTDGIVRRVDSANATPLVTDVTPPGLNGGTAQGGFVRCVAVDPTNSNKALVAFGNYNFRNLWYTTDGGATWIDVEGNLAGDAGPSIRWATIFYVGNQLNIYLATSIGVLMTNQLNGASTVWSQAAAAEIGNVLIAYLDYRPSDRTLAVGTHSRGVFTTQIPLTSTEVDEGETPTEFSLEQNYPNPFNPTTKLSFVISSAAAEPFVTMQVFDVSGKVVATLVNETLAEGRYERTFTAHGLASGVYFYRLTTGSFSKTKKMIFSK